eukprot:TRINITY_DN99_c0_g1_i12.p1 TRINITY_DN99_c0_g1~~TRINITY_DN99_c0_g1_i12.p1  ORF type:complete len:1135 (-),score=189.56 TRINITY_DN99_c0_g1_i12:69-3344(-)
MQQNATGFDVDRVPVPALRRLQAYHVNSIATNTCSSGCKLTDSSDCQAAAWSLGKHYNVYSYRHTFHEPSGCVLDMYREEVYFNSHPTGSEADWYKPICGPCQEVMAGDDGWIESESRMQLLLERVEYAFNVAAQWSFYLLGFVAVMISFYVLPALIDTCILRQEMSLMICIYYVLSSYCGLLYILYIITVPVFGRPEHSWRFPNAPHFSPARYNKAAQKYMFVRMVINGIGLALGSYLAILLVMFICGMIVVIPIVCVLMGVLLCLTRAGNAACRYLKDEAAAHATNEKPKEKDAEKSVRRAVEAYLRTHYPGLFSVELPDLPTLSLPHINIPYWGWPSLSFYFELPMPDLPSFFCPCLSPMSLRLPDCLKMVFVDFPVLFFSVGLPSLFKFLLDFFFVLTLCATFLVNFPQFQFRFGLDLQLPEFDFFGIQLPFDSVRIPQLRLPDWRVKCQGFFTLAAVLNLFAATFAASVIISSDIFACLFDRDKRMKMMKESKGAKKKMEAKAIKEALEKNPEAPGLKKPGFIPNRQVAMEMAADSLKFSINSMLVQLLLYMMGIIVNEITVSLADVALRVLGEAEPPLLPEVDECMDGIVALSWILSLYGFLCTLFYGYRVLSGQVHKDGVYILSAALVQEERLLTWDSLYRLIGIIRLSVGCFLLPFIFLGVEKQDMQRVKSYASTSEYFEKMDRHEKISLHDIDLGQAAERSEAPVAKSVLSVLYVKFVAVFSADNTLANALWGLDFDESEGLNVTSTSKTAARDLKSVDDFRLVQYADTYSTLQGKRLEGWCGKQFRMAIFGIFGVMGSEQAESCYAAERCVIWQCQIEQIYKANCKLTGLSLLMIPFFGTAWNTFIQNLSDVPAFLSVRNEKDASDILSGYSFFANSGNIEQVKWMKLAYICVVLRFVCLLASLYSTSRVLYCALAAMLFAMVQHQFMMRSNQAQNQRIAKAILGSVGGDAPAPPDGAERVETEDQVQNEPIAGKVLDSVGRDASGPSHGDEEQIQQIENEEEEGGSIVAGISGLWNSLFQGSVSGGGDASGPSDGAVASGPSDGADASGPSDVADASGPSDRADASGTSDGRDSIHTFYI